MWYTGRLSGNCCKDGRWSLEKRVEENKPDIVLLCVAASDITRDIAVEKKFITLWCGRAIHGMVWNMKMIS